MPKVKDKNKNWKPPSYIQQITDVLVPLSRCPHSIVFKYEYICSLEKSFENLGTCEVQSKHESQSHFFFSQKYCSLTCFRAAEFYKKQLETSPVWLREHHEEEGALVGDASAKKKPSSVRLYDPDKDSARFRTQRDPESLGCLGCSSSSSEDEERKEEPPRSVYYRCQSLYRQLGLLCSLHPTKLCTKFKIFRKKEKIFGAKVTSETFLSISQNLKVTRLEGGTQTKLWTCWRNFDLSRSFERFSGSFMALLCSSRWSDQKCCKAERVALISSFQPRPMWALNTHFLARYRFLKWGSKFRIFYKTLKIFNNFSRQNHGHGGHEHCVCRGVLGVSCRLRRCPRAVASVLCKKTAIFWVPTIKVRPPDGILLVQFSSVSCSVV